MAKTRKPLTMLKPKLKTADARPAGLKMAESADSWRAGKGKSSTARGYGYKWQQYRLRYLARHPLCAFCEAKGLLTPATVVDHKTPHRGDQDLFWDESNHQPLCKPCHDGEKQRMEKSGQVEQYSIPMPPEERIAPAAAQPRFGFGMA